MLLQLTQQEKKSTFSQFKVVSSFYEDTVVIESTTMWIYEPIGTPHQGCQLSRIWRDSHAFDLLLTHSRNWQIYSRI